MTGIHDLWVEMPLNKKQIKIHFKKAYNNRIKENWKVRCEILLLLVYKIIFSLELQGRAVFFYSAFYWPYPRARDNGQ